MEYNVKPVELRKLGNLQLCSKNISLNLCIVPDKFYTFKKMGHQENINFQACSLTNNVMVVIRAPERWERWECVPSQFEILAATFG